MAAFNIHLARFITGHLDFLTENGVDFRVADSLAEVQPLLAKKDMDRLSISQPFDLALNDVLPHNMIWIYGLSKSGRLQHIHAIRLDDLKDVSLGEWWQMHLQRVVRHGVGPVLCPAAEAINGRVSYHGQMWLRKRYRHKGIAAALCRLGNAVAFSEWKHDCIYVFCSRQLVYTGFTQRMLFCRSTPNAVNWQNGKPAFDRDDWLNWSTRSDMVWLFSQPPSSYF